MLFPDLELLTLGNPLSDPDFRFNKGETTNFPYMNLSGGEKAAFNLILDIVVKREAYDNTVYCIDEPEVHLNPKIYSKFLKILVGLIPENSQLWISTHAIGMMRAALELYKKDKNSVVFLDFETVGVEKKIILEPIVPSRSFWEKVLNVALNDLSELVAPSELVVCEGTPTELGANLKHADHDAKCYGNIFAMEYPDAVFISGGNNIDVQNDRYDFITLLPAIIKGIKVKRLIDKDDMSEEQIQKCVDEKILVLLRRNIESYLYDDEVIEFLYTSNELNMKNKDKNIQDLINNIKNLKVKLIEDSSKRGNPLDDIKKIAANLYQQIKKDLNIENLGSTNSAFEIAVLSKYIKPDMMVYKELQRIIFG